jgi:tetratricopeptide (TPR) repeat protein
VIRRLLITALLAGIAACSNAPGGDSAYERGLAALAEGQPRTARIEFLNAIKEQPNSPKLRLFQAETYLALGDGIAAQAELERAQQLGARPAETSHLMAHALLVRGDYVGSAEKAAAAGPEHRAYASRIRGLALMNSGDLAGAAAAFEHAIRAGPNDHRVWVAVARFRRAGGDLAGAVAAADKAIALKADDVEAIVLRGELTRSQYGLRAALPWFDRAIEIDSGNVVALLERAATFGDMGAMRAMLADTRKALSLSPANARAYFLQAMLAARGGDFELARSLHQRTRGAFDGQPAGMLLASAIDYQTGAYSQAVLRLTRLVGLQPDNRKARKLLAASQWRLGDAAATVATLRPIADRPDADSYTLALIGLAMEKQRNPSAAYYLARAAQPEARAATSLASAPVTDEELARLRAAAARRPSDPQPQIRLVAALLSRGLGAEALLLARRVQADNPGAPDAHMLVGDALGTRGDFAGAAEQYRRAANLAFTEPVAMRLIEALERSAQRPAAAQVLQLFLEQNPGSVPATLLAGQLYLQARDWPAAIRTYESLRKRLGDRDAAMLNNLAWAYAERGDHVRAIPLARKAWALEKANPATADTLGWILFKSGVNKAEGLMLIERAARGAPGDAEIRKHLAAARRG